MKSFLFALTLGGLLTVALHASAQPSDPAWRSKNKRDNNRYEGTYQKLISGSATQRLISFTSNKPPYQFQMKQTLALKWYLPSEGKWDIHAEDTNQKFYWMEPIWTPAVGKWNSFSPWPVDAVLGSLMITSRDLALIARQGPPAQVYTPVYIYLSGTQPTVTHYVLLIEVGQACSKGDYTLRKAGTSGAPLFSNTISSRQAGGIINVVIPAEKFVTPNSYYDLTVKLFSEGATPTANSQTYRLYVPARP